MKNSKLKLEFGVRAAACGGRASSDTNCGPPPPPGCGPHGLFKAVIQNSNATLRMLIVCRCFLNGVFRVEIDREAIGSPQPPPGGGLHLRVPQVRSCGPTARLRAAQFLTGTANEKGRIKNEKLFSGCSPRWVHATERSCRPLFLIKILPQKTPANSPSSPPSRSRAASVRFYSVISQRVTLSL